MAIERLESRISVHHVVHHVSREVDLDDNHAILLVEYGVTDSSAVNWIPIGYEAEFVRTPSWKIWADA